MTALAPLPPATLRLEEDLPFVTIAPGTEIKVAQVDLDAGLWIVRNRFAPGAVVPTHRHTGSVLAFTETGAWKYAEYPGEVNRAGSYLFEPAGSTHTLTVLEDAGEPTLVWFVIHGANLELDADGRVDRVVDAARVLRGYKRLCAEAGLPTPRVIGDPDAPGA